MTTNQQQRVQELKQCGLSTREAEAQAKQEQQHTPGPWKDGPVFGVEGRSIFWTDESKPGKWQRRLDSRPGVFTEADARLIAAAPDLAEALLAMYRESDGGWRNESPTAERVRAALTKAGIQP